MMEKYVWTFFTSKNFFESTKMLFPLKENNLKRYLTCFMRMIKLFRDQRKKVGFNWKTEP
jgi:hypothetical protein